ncbi:MAG: signal peptidase I [Leptolyngbyaceae cyanobacterium]
MSPASLTNSTRPPADPWFAVNCALIFPGLGQLYSQHRWKGGGLLAIALFLLLYAVWSVFGAAGNTLYGLGALGLLVLLYSFSILDAYRGTQANYATRISVPKGRQDVWYAVFLSQLLPGLGHLYAQQATTGGGLLLVGLITAWLANQQPLLAPIPPAVWAFSCYHLYHSFPKRSRRQPTAIALLILGLFVTRLVLGNAPHWINETFIQCLVPSDSMVPTLQVGDQLFVRRHQSYQPAVGDIVVFEPPAALRQRLPERDQNDLIVKRIIGSPNQQLEVREQRVLVEGQPLSEPYVQSPPSYDWGPKQVPPVNYFVLGDNRDRSNDSHIWGYLPMENILGRAYKIYWPPGRIQPLSGG